jgi:hypothetical protein
VDHLRLIDLFTLAVLDARAEVVGELLQSLIYPIAR